VLVLFHSEYGSRLFFRQGARSASQLDRNMRPVQNKKMSSAAEAFTFLDHLLPKMKGIRPASVGSMNSSISLFM
jgi:hypothetical protein